MTPKHRRPESPHPVGYTLIEMLIAVSLVAVLMTAVWGLMSMYTTLQTTGAEATAEQQLVRSVLQLIHADLAAVSLPPVDETAAIDDPFAAFDAVDSDTGSGSEATASNSFSVVLDIRDLQRNPDAGPANFTLTGSETAIRFTVPRLPAPPPPPTEIDQLNQLGGGTAEAGDRLPDGVAPVVNEFQTIVWQFQPFGSSEQGGLPFGLYRIQTDAARMQTLLSYQQRPDDEFASDPIELNREMLEMLLFPPADDFDDTSGQPPGETLCDLIPEVVGWRIEYYSGDSWTDRWEGTRTSRLPDAIRLSLDVVSATETDSLQNAFIPDGPPGPLEKQLLRNVSRSQPAPRRPAESVTLEELRITPRRYSSLVLLNPVVDSRSTAPLDDGGFE